MRGYLYGAVDRFTCSCSSRASCVVAHVPRPQDHHGLDHRAALGVGRGHGRGLGDGRDARPARTRPRTARSGSRPTGSRRRAGPRTRGSRRRRGAPGRRCATARVGERRLAEVAAEERRHGGGIEAQLAVVGRPPLLVEDLEPEARERPAHRARAHRARPRACRSAGRSRSGRSRRGCRGSIAARKTSITSGLSGSPADTRRRSAGGRPPSSEVALGDHAVLGRRLAEDGDALLGGDRKALLGIEARVVQQARGAGRPRRDERVARRLRPAARGRAPGRARPARGPSQCSRLHGLPAQVALRVHDAARLARGAGGEDHERRVGRRGVRRVARRRAPAGSPSASTSISAAGCSASRQRRARARPCRRPAASTSAGARALDPQRDVLGAQLLRAGQRDRSQPPGAEQREDPFRPRAHQRHHDVAAPDAGRARGRPRVSAACRATSANV